MVVSTLRDRFEIDKARVLVAAERQAGDQRSIDRDVERHTVTDHALCDAKPSAGKLRGANPKTCRVSITTTDRDGLSEREALDRREDGVEQRRDLFTPSRDRDK